MATALWYLLLCWITVDCSLSVSASEPEANRQPRVSEMEEYTAFEVQVQTINSSVIQEPVPVTCSENYINVALDVAETMLIQTPGYPTSNYTPGTKCGWNVKTSFGNQLLLECPKLNMAEDDYLDIWDLSTNGQLEISFKEDNFLHQLLGSDAKIGLVSEFESLGGKGFVCSISAIPPPPDCVCGMKFNGYFTWLVKVGKGKCIGVIISREWVLTAASCISGGKTTIEYDYGGSTTSTSLVRISKSIKHTSFNPQTNEHDIALLRMPAKDWKNIPLRPVCMPRNTSDTYSNRMAIAFGWLNPFAVNQWNAANLKTTKLEIQSDLACRALAAATGSTTTSNRLCALQSSGSLPMLMCQFATGAPIVVSDGTSFELVGITPAGGGCKGPNLPDIYTRVTDYMDWINEHVSWCDDCPRSLNSTGDAEIYPE